MTCHYPELGSTSDWWCREGNVLQPIRSTADYMPCCSLVFRKSEVEWRKKLRGEKPGATFLPCNFAMNIVSSL